MDAERENMDNMHDELTHKTIDAVCDRHEQTYTEFMQGFTFLTPQDLIKEQRTSQFQDHCLQFSHKTGGEAVVPSRVTKKNDSEENDLEEETLGNSEVVPPIMSRPNSEHGRSLIKVDNFIEDHEDSSDDNDDGDNHWTENGLDPLDQAELSGYVPSSVYIPSSMQTKTENSQVVQTSDRPQTDSESTDATFAFSKESTDNQLLETISEHKSVNNDENTQDSESNCENSEMTGLFPGEVEDENIPQTNCKINLRKLDLGSTKGNIPVSSTSDTQATDEVRTFVLDEDFDYDNVILTPKFTIGELEEMRRLVEMTAD